MDGTSLSFAPLLPWPALAALALAILAVCGLGLWRRARGILWRGAMLALGLLALANPVVVREQRQGLDDIAVVLVDRSPSQSIGARPEQLDQALASLREELQGSEGLEVVEATTAGDGKGGTRLFATLGTTLSEIDRARLAGVLILSDGQVHDVPADLAALAIDAPLHLLLTGQRDEQDRRLTVEQVPNYGMVGDQEEITLRVDQLPAGDAGRADHGDLAPGRRAPAAPDRAGRRGAHAAVRADPRRADRARARGRGGGRRGHHAQQSPGVLRQRRARPACACCWSPASPIEGLRVWRNLLKADPAVDLVHFTILRPPEKQDGTPIRELALIAFPSRELFEVKLGEFDLVIFDRYSRRGLMPLAYLDNVARYVEEGGGLLEIAGPEFAHPLSLYRTPLARVLPARPSGVVYERGFTPALTELGQRHPVTAGLAEATADGQDAAADQPPWGRWFRQVDVEVTGSQVLMDGAAERPLLVLNRVGEGPGRAAALGPGLAVGARLRGRRSAGPAAAPPGPLADAGAGARGGGAARRAGGRGDRDRAPLARGRSPATATVTAPSGRTSQVTLEPSDQGVARATVPAAEAGLYRISDGEHTTYVAVRPIGAEELSDMRATPERLAPLVEASGGAVHWLADGGAPGIRKVARGRALSGRGWVGLQRNERYLVTGASQLPLLPAVVALMLLLGTLGSAWYREGR